MTITDCINFINSDYRRLAPVNYGIVRYLITNASFKITFWFRIGSFLKQKRGLWQILYFIVAIIYKHYQYKTGIQLPLGTKVGAGLLFAHFGAVVINENAEIGAHCTIYQCVTIGSTRGSVDGTGKFIVGDHVVIFSGACIVKAVSIGKNSVIAANAVVTSNVPEGVVYGGVPGKVLSHNGEYITRLY